MNLLGSFWALITLFFWAFAFIAYLIILFSIVADLFRDRELSGWWKAVWLVFLVFLPFVTALVYLVARGRGMAARQTRDAERAQAHAAEYLRSVASVSPTDDIAKAKQLFDAGAVTATEFETLKSRALARA